MINLVILSRRYKTGQQHYFLLAKNCTSTFAGIDIRYIKSNIEMNKINLQSAAKIHGCLYIAARFNKALKICI